MTKITLEVNLASSANPASMSSSIVRTYNLYTDSERKILISKVVNPTKVYTIIQRFPILDIPFRVALGILLYCDLVVKMDTGFYSY